MSPSSLSKMAGGVFIVLGIISIAYPFYSSLGVEILFGALFLAGGIFQLFAAFEEKQRKNILWDFCIGVLYILAGVYLLSHPVGGLLSLTMVLIVLFYIQGFLTLFSGFSQRLRGQQRFWVTLSGLLTLGIASILLFSYPISGLWALGLLIGVNLLFFGISILCGSCVLSELDKK